MSEYIVGVALKVGNHVFIGFKPKRHDYVIGMAIREGVPPSECGNQGFYTSTWRFVDRVEGAKIATQAKQLLYRESTDFLCSEDIW